MPVIIPQTLPAKATLESENIFVIKEKRALAQDIRALNIAILNLMPTKVATETQILRLLSNTALQIEVTLLHTCSHQARNTPAEHLLAHYFTLDEVQDEKFDGLVITGAPVEHLDFEDVDYWKELVSFFKWSETNVFSTMHICWAAQAGLYHHYGIPKYHISKKVSGVYQHQVLRQHTMLLRGFDDQFFAPHSRYTEIRRSDIQKVADLDILSESDEAGIYVVCSKDRRQVYVTGHSEYDPLTLKLEYERDLAKGIPIAPPRNYFPDDDPTRPPMVKWRGHAHLLFSNWLNYYVYQRTPFDIDRIPLNGNGPSY